MLEGFCSQIFANEVSFIISFLRNRQSSILLKFAGANGPELLESHHMKNALFMVNYEFSEPYVIILCQVEIHFKPQQAL